MESQPINIEQTLVLCNHNRELVLELVTILKTDLPRQKKILLDAFQAKDYQLMRDILHQILGSCSYIAMPKIKRQALILQSAIHHSHDSQQKQLDAMIKAIDDVVVCTYP